MKNNMIRLVILIIIGYLVLWFAGAMCNFFPFIANDLVYGAIGFTGLLICVVIVVCTCWIISEIKKK